MRIVDLTRCIMEDMPVFPGDPAPRLTPDAHLEALGFRTTSLALNSHTGTHIDAPAHIFPDGTFLDELPLACFCGRALCVDCRALKPGARLGISMLDAVRHEADRAEFIILRTGWEQYWGRAEYFQGFPLLAEDFAAYLTSSGKKGLGLDAPSIDPAADVNVPLHRKLLGAGLLLVENLCNLEQLESSSFYFCALPLKFAGSDGAPARAAAFFPVDCPAEKRA